MPVQDSSRTSNSSDLPNQEGRRREESCAPDKRARNGEESYSPDKRASKREESHSPEKRATKGEERYPPDKGGKGGYISYAPALTVKARQNRKQPTPAENKLWFEVLQDKRFAGLKFTRQKPLDKYIVDFYCAALMLAIEIDGDSHMEQAAYDGQRTSRLNQLGVKVIRYANRDILTSLDTVYEDLLKRIQRRRDEFPESPLLRGPS